MDLAPNSRCDIKNKSKKKKIGGSHKEQGSNEMEKSRNSRRGNQIWLFENTNKTNIWPDLPKYENNVRKI